MLQVRTVSTLESLRAGKHTLTSGGGQHFGFGLSSLAWILLWDDASTGRSCHGHVPRPGAPSAISRPFVGSPGGRCVSGSSSAHVRSWWGHHKLLLSHPAGGVSIQLFCPPLLQSCRPRRIPWLIDLVTWTSKLSPRIKLVSINGTLSLDHRTFTGADTVDSNSPGLCLLESFSVSIEYRSSISM